MLTLRDVKKEYGEGESAVVALKGVTVSFRESEFVAILGPSGCGKTTLLNIIGGLDHYTSGDLSIRGVSTKLYRDADWDAYRNHSVGFVFQSYNLIPHQSVLSNVELALTLSGVSKAERRQRATDALIRVGLGDQLKKRPNQLSGGQMQRVAIARALVNDPDVLLADEPTGALDTETSIQVMDLLREVAREKLVVMVTHNPDLADRYATRTIRLLDGEIVGDTDPFEPDAVATQPTKEKIDDTDPYEPDAAATQPTEVKTPEAASPAPEAARPAKEKKRKAKKRSMSLLTALSLSLNNLMTKKGRTFLTSFAGSIGIIGIALILALSNGINIYIRHIQEDALSSYPITINREETDLVSMISSLGEQRNGNRDHPTDDGNVYSSPVFYNLINTLLAPDKSENNLTAFKKYVDGGAFDGVNATIQYGYDIPLTVYTKDAATGEYVSSDVNALINGISGGGALTDSTDGATAATGTFSFSSSFSSYSVWGEVLGGKDGELVADLVKEQYDLVAGEWPTGAGDVLLVLSDYDEVNDLTLYALGLKSENDMRQMMIAAFTGNKIEQPETEKWTYKEILGRTFRTIAPARLYQLVGDKWQNVSNQQAVLDTMLSSDEMSIGLRVSGILRKNPDATSTSATGTLLYTSALTKYLIDSTLNSRIVQAQLSDPDTDVLTGLPFKVDPSTKPKNDEERVSRLTEYVASLTPAAKAELLRTMLTTHYDHQIDLTDPDANSVRHLTRRVSDAVKQMMTMIGTSREEITAWVNAYYPEYASFISYFEDEDELVETVQTLLTLKVAQELEAQGEAIYESYRNTPSESEIAARAAGILAQLENREAKEGYVVGIYKNTTEISEDTLTAWAAGLLDDELDGVTETLARDAAKAMIAADPTVDEAKKDERCAAVLDGIVGSFSEAEKSAAYQYFVPDGSANTTYEETLAKLYVCDEDTPSRISIYVTTFAEKDKVTDLIAKYNESADEDDQIAYTDIMALLMTSVTYILNAVTYVLIAFVSVSLVVSSIMIGIITYISVLERTKEIGILRAIGASKRDVSRVFNAETLIIGFSAGLIGIIVTLLFCIPINLILRALTGIGNIAAVLPVGGAVALVLISMALTLLAGLIPSRMASKKDPVVALRTE